MTMTPNVSPALVLAVLAAAVATSAGFPPASADELSDLRANQALVNSRIDQLAKPGDAQMGSPPTPDNPLPSDPNTAGSGSFPRSFLIPGTSTSVRVGGSVDQTMHYHANGP
jgi:hypothetical protein